MAKKKAPTVVYVHGICRHDAGYSDGWWTALRPHLKDWPAENRVEVLWSNAVRGEASEAAELMSRVVLESVSAGRPGRRGMAGDAEEVITEQILDLLADRAARQETEAVLDTMEESESPEAGRHALPMSFTAAPEAMINIPGVACLNDFGIYLTDNSVRAAVIKCFTDVVKPRLKRGEQLELITHSWGTVVAYEGLCELEEDGGLASGLVNSWFTVGAALAITPVWRMLRPNATGHKPRLVRTWVNLNARFDIVGGAMQGRYAVDDEYLGLRPVGCSNIIPNPMCAHRSYFLANNVVTNRDIFAATILA